jgi:hemerythrin-like metal-binding protein
MSDILTVESIRNNNEKIKELIDYFSKLIDENKCETEIVNVFHKISFYTHEFFINEELYMKKYDIPFISSHIKEHREFADKMIAFQKEFEAGKVDLCPKLLSFLKYWYEKHVQNSDEAIIGYIERE